MNIVVQSFGEEVYAKLKAGMAKGKSFDLVVDLLVDYHKRNSDFNLTNNLLITLVKVVILSHEYHSSQVTGNCEVLIKSLGLSEEQRVMLYKHLFDEEGMYTPTIRIYRYSHRESSSWLLSFMLSV